MPGYNAHESLGASAQLIRTSDGWRVKLVWEDGEEDFISGPAFPTAKEAKRAFTAWCISVGIKPETMQ